MAVAENEEKELLESLIDTTELGANLKTLEDYYSAIDRQLNRQMSNRQRDPFEKKFTQPLEPLNNEPLFIPQQPFTPAPAATTETNPTASAQSTRPVVNLAAFPAMQFKGFMQSTNGKAGLLEIQGQGTFVVHEGDQVGLRQNNGETVIRVVEINALNLIVEFGSIGAKVVVQ